MPGNVSQSQANPKSLKINDWTAGIVNQDYATTGSQSIFFGVAPNASPKVSSSPYSFGVMGLPGGGLLLGPTVFSVTTPTLTLPDGASGPVVTGVINDLGLGTNNDTGKYVVINSKVGTAMDTSLYYMAEGGATSLGTALNTGVNYNPAYIPSITIPFSTTMIPGVAGSFYVAIIWTPELQVTWYCPGFGLGAGDFGSPLGVYAIPQNGRIWGFGQAYGTNQINNAYSVGVYYTNAINYTNTVTNTWANATTPAIVDFDSPELIGAWGSLMNAETLLIKVGEGAVLISGDIFSPTVTKLPQIRGTNGFMGEATVTPLGLVYRVKGNGVWAWNGGSTATKISTQISDTLFYEASPASRLFPSGVILQGPGQNAGTGGPNTNLIFTSTYVNNNIFFDSGWILNLDTNSWWKLPWYGDANGGWNPDNPFSPYFYTINHNIVNTPSKTGFPCPVSAIGFGNSTAGQSPTGFYSTNYAFDVSGGSYSFVPPNNAFASYWESNPIQLATEGIVEVQEINVVMKGSGTLQVDCNGIGGATLASKTIAVDTAQYKRFPIITKFETDVLTLKVGWVNSTPVCTPVIESIQLDFVDRYPVKKAN